MKLQAVQTGFVRIKTAQVEGRGHGLSRRLSIFTDPNWTEWLPTYAWVIDTAEGVLVVDTGQGAHLLQSGSSLHPYVRWEVAFRIEPEQEIGPQLRALGIGPRDVKRVILTHLHMDHDGGLAHFPDSEILAAPGETEDGERTRRTTARLSAPSLAVLVRSETARSRRRTVWSLRIEPPIDASGDVVAVATPGHTADHVSVVVRDGDIAYFLAGDTSYDEALMLAGKLDGVSADEHVSGATLDAIRRFVQSRPTVYLPTHDPRSAERLANRQTAAVSAASAA